MEKRSRRIDAMPTKHGDVEEQLRLDIYYSVYPRPLTIEFDSGLVDRDPRRLRRRRVVKDIIYSMYSLMDRLMRAFQAKYSKNRLCLAKRTTGCVEPGGNTRQGVRRPLPLPVFTRNGV